MSAERGFSGTAVHGLDAKNRIFIPANQRAALGETFQIYRAADRCLRLYPQKEWDVIAEAANDLIGIIDSKDDGDTFRARMIFGKVDECKMDKQGRITLSARQLKYADIESEVAIVGMGKFIELWNAQKWSEFMGEE